MLKGSFDTGDPLTTNLYVGNINPKVNVCAHVLVIINSLRMRSRVTVVGLSICLSVTALTAQLLILAVQV